MPLIPYLIPSVPASSGVTVGATANTSSLYDLAIDGVQFMYSNSPNNPMIRQTVPLEKGRIDQAATPGEQTLTSWWIKSQDSWHGGAGQLQLEPAFPTPLDHIRFDGSKNADVWTPGRISRLPDTTVVSTDNATAVVGVLLSGVDAIVYLDSSGTVKLVTDPAGTPSISSFTGVTDPVLSIDTDGTSVYAATATEVYKLTPATPSAAAGIATYTAATTGPAIGWVKSRLMLGLDGGVYQLDVTVGSPTAITSADALYVHPSTGFVWRCFGVSPHAVLAAGDAGGLSSITQFTVQNVSGAPVLQVDGDIATLPVGERVISLANSQGTFLAIGTTQGVRIGSFDTYLGNLTYGPLELLPTDPVIPANGLTTRDRFVYVAGMAYDEGGLIRLDLGTQTDQAGRVAWASDLICPTATDSAATAVCSLPVAGSIVFSVTGTGVLIEGVGAGTGRESWLRTSRIRFGTVEPKLWKLGQIRGELANGQISVESTTPYSTDPVIDVGNTTSEPDEFRLDDSASRAEWLQLTLTLTGETVALTSYQVKALPGSRKQMHYQFVVSINDKETTRSGQQIKNTLSSRVRLNRLEQLAQSGDEVTLQEFTPQGVVSTRVVVEEVSFHQSGRPTRRSDIGGTASILLRTVES